MQDKQPVQNEHGDFIGWQVTAARSPTRAPESRVYAGNYFSLHPVDADAHAQALFTAATAMPAAERIWTYLPYGPFSDADAMAQHLLDCAKSRDPLFFTVIDNHSSNPVGMVSFLNIATLSRTIELGHIWYVPQVHGSKANTEISYLMLCEAFDNLHYRRVEWKCNALNLKSRSTAQRMGFSFEGVFRQHLIVKGQNRDTAWLALLDHEWPEVRANMASWLYHQDADKPVLSLTELNRPLLHAHDPVLSAARGGPA